MEKTTLDKLKYIGCFWGLICVMGIIYAYYVHFSANRTFCLTIHEMSAIISAEDIPDKDNIKGVRDFVWCMDSGAGMGKREIGYFNVFTKDEKGPRIYRGIYNNGKFEVLPISLERDDGIDDLGVSIGSVIYRNGVYQLFYSGLTTIEGRPRYYTYNTAFSDDGLNFSGKKTLLTNEAFDSVNIGLPYTILIEGAEQCFLMMCEGTNLDTKQYCVFGAYGNEKLNFSALNGGHPILTGQDITWPMKVGGVANPKIKKDPRGKFYLGFNATDLGVHRSAFRLGTGTFSFEHGDVTDIIIDGPIIMPYGEDMKRIESTEIIYDSHMNPLEITFFATPTYDATLGATIYRGVFKNIKNN